MNERRQSARGRAWRSRRTRDANGEETKRFHFEVKTFERLEPKVMRGLGVCRVVARTV